MDNPNISEYRKTDSGIGKEDSAGFVIFHQEKGQRKYLILHYLSGRYDFAQGHLEEGEDYLQAAYRELQEETGLKPENIEIIPRFSVQINYSFRRIHALINKTATLFLARSNTLEVTVSDEHQGYLWLDYQSAVDKITYDKERRVVIDAEKYLKKLELKNKSHENHS